MGSLRWPRTYMDTKSLSMGWAPVATGQAGREPSQAYHQATLIRSPSAISGAGEKQSNPTTTSHIRLFLDTILVLRNPTESTANKFWPQQ